MKLSTSVLLTQCALPLAQGLTLWSSSPAQANVVIQQGYPLGNGRLGAMTHGPPGSDRVVLNIDSLWSGGPFESKSYNGGNPTSDVSHYLAGIRSNIFTKGTGSVTQLETNDNDYGAFQVFGNLSVAISGVSSSSSYKRQLDFATGLHTTVYTANDGNTYTSTVYCSYPDQVCVYNVSSTSTLPQIAISLENQLAGSNVVTASCTGSYVRLRGRTYANTGMIYDGIAQLMSPPAGTACSGSKLIVPAGKTRTISLVFGAGTNYDWAAGDAAHSFSFAGADPSAYVMAVTTAAAAKLESDMREAHVLDYQSLAGQFTLDLPDPSGSAGTETSSLINAYKATGSGNPYLESTLFHLGRHMFISAGRDNSFPPNAAGRWNPDLSGAWGDDYHANINEQMALWGAELTGLGDLMVATMNYMEYTWVPRGTQAALLIYGAKQGWVTHNEMNIFGHTGMKPGGEQYANYPAASAWMMQHVYDRYSYGQNVTWYLQQGYPLLKGVAQFWLSQLQLDTYNNDGTYVANPCSSPEHGPVSFGCTHFQQLIYQVFVSITTTASVLPASESAFVAQVAAALKTLDKGLHIGTWGEIKEWKIPESSSHDFKNDTHRHLSHLIGWFPGWSVASYLGGYTDKTIQNAVTTSLWSRGIGVADANAGWEKVWRSACWATLNNTERAYYELKYAIGTNYAINGLSMYSGKNQPFQIDANFGLLGAMLRMLIVDNPQLSGKEQGRTVVLGPAIPSTWAGGKVTGMRLRGGGSVDFSWDANGLVNTATLNSRTQTITIVNKQGTVLAKV